MDFDLSLIATAIFCIFLSLFLRQIGSRSRMPPGPLPLPVLGNMLQLASQSRSHQAFQSLAAKYGPLMTLDLGSMRTVVVSSPDAAREMFKVHDLALAGRTLYEAMKTEVDHSSHGSIVTAEYGASWRLLRRLCALEFFSNSRLNAMKDVRRECVDAMVEFVREGSEDGKKAIEVAKFVFYMNFNLLGNLMFSRNLVDPKCKEGNEFFDHAGTVMEIVGKPNVADFIPILSRFDPQGIRRSMRYHLEKAFEITSGFTKERIETSRKKEDHEKKNKKDYLDVLLEFKGNGRDEPSSFTPSEINGTALEMFIAGTDTTTSAIEWTMSEVLRNPTVLSKLMEELCNVVGSDRKLEEDDMDNLPYLRAVVKETMRLHPPLPLMVPHKATESCIMMGYHIPKDTQIIVNAWAIGRDAKAWEDPHSFKPERFMDSNVDYNGQHFEFLPFGSGRRRCPGMPLAHRVVPLAVGTLLLTFDWVLPEGLKAEELDMTEKLGITLKKSKPLRAIPLPRKTQKPNTSSISASD